MKIRVETSETENRKPTGEINRTLKGRDITLLTKVHLVKTMVFSVVMYGCKGWTIKKAEQ